jgi:hypothetical protein
VIQGRIKKYLDLRGKLNKLIIIISTEWKLKVCMFTQQTENQIEVKKREFKGFKK